MSITIPMRRGPAKSRPLPAPKPQFLQMAAAQMASEGKFGQAPQAQPSDAAQSMQPSPPALT